MGTLTAFLAVDRESGRDAPVAEAEPLLEARNLVKHYGQVLALDGANFTAYPGVPAHQPPRAAIVLTRRADPAAR